MPMPAAPLARTMRAPIRRAVPLLAALSLLACGGSSSDGGGKSAPTYAVGGTLSGLASGTLVLSSGIDSFEL